MKKQIMVLLAALALAAALTAQAAAQAAPTGLLPAGAPAGMPAGGIMPGGAPGGMAQAADTSWIKTRFIDLPYAGISATQKLDLYIPNEGTGPFPLIIELHPGGFMVGSKSGDIGPMLKGLERGYAVASVNYRLSAEAIFPAAVNDIKAAIKFLRANAGTYNLDPARFATWGSSAGGNLSAMAATSGDVPSLVDPSLGNATVSDSVQAAIDWFGPVLFSTMDAEFATLGTSGIMGLTNAATSAESKYLGKVVGTPEAQPLVDAASPMTYVSIRTPPLYFQHGTADRNVPYLQSKNLAARVASFIGADKVRFELLEGAGHGGSQFSAADNVHKILDFLDSILR
jgi:acetyl esterase/lipase